MSIRPRISTLSYCVGLALAQMSGMALADSAIGQNTTLGNATNPAPINSTMIRAGGLDAEGAPPKRTPSGLMYDIPAAETDEADSGASSVHATIEGGVQSVSGDKNAALFKQYKDVKKGAVINSFSVDGENTATANFVEVVGGGVARDDQFYGVQFGKYNDWKVKAFYNETNHVFTTTAKPIWSGVGTGNLSLLPGIPAGGGVVFIGNNAAAQTAGAALAAGNLCSNPAGGANLAASTAAAPVPCFISTVYGSPAGTATYGAAGALVNPVFVGVPLTAAALGGAATTTTNGGINSLAARAIMAAQSAMGYSELGLIRKNGGLSLDASLTDSWKMFATATTEKREGARPLGMVQGTFGGPSVELPEPIDYLTTDFKGGFRYADPLTKFNVMATASLFHNNNASLTVDNPWLAATTATGGLMDQSRMSLAPSNQAYSIKGEFARSLPDFYKGTFNATASWGTTRQNENLLPQTITSGQGTTNPAQGAFNGNFNQWNSTADLSQRTANARIDSKLIDLKLSLHPNNDLSVAGKLRYQSTDNKTNYVNCNPNATYGDGTQYTAWGCTGVFGSVYADGASTRLLNNFGVASGVINTGALAATAVPSSWTGIGPLRNIPWDNKQLAAGLSADYRIDKTSSFNAAYDRENVDRRNREVNTTHEDKLKLGYTNRGIEKATVRLSYEYDQKRGSGYNPLTPYLPYGGESFFNLAATPASAANTTNLANAVVARASTLRKLDVSDRNQNIFNGRLNYAVREDMDFGVSYQWKEADYPESNTLGRDNTKSQTLNFDLNYQPSAGQTMYGFYSRQNSSMNQKNNQNGAQTIVAGSLGPAFVCNLGVSTPWGVITADNAQSICGDPSHNISFDPLKAYSVESKDTNDVLGLGFRQAFAKNTLDVNFVYSHSRTKIGYNYVDPVAAGETTAVAANAVGLAGSGMSDITFSTYKLNGSYLIPIDKKMSVRLAASQEYGKSVDWRHPDNLQQNLVLGVGTVQMDAGPQSYNVSTVGVLLQYKM